MRFFLFCAGMAGFIGVSAGAFGAHGLRETLEPRYLEIWNTGADYLLWHALALFGVALLAHGGETRALALAGWSFLVGSVIFPGSLFLLALTGIGWLGAVTPIGGVAFLVGWGSVAWHGLKSGQKS